MGSIEAGKLADLVLWKPMFFGVKPEIVIKGGFIAWSVMGDANASIPTPQLVFYRRMFGAFGKAMHGTSLTLVSRAAFEREIPKRLGLEKRVEAVAQCRDIGKEDTIHNNATPIIEVDSETYEVRADGELLTCEPATVLPMPHQDGKYVNGQWAPGRWLNGDQTHQGRHIRLPPGKFDIQRVKLYRYH